MSNEEPVQEEPPSERAEFLESDEEFEGVGAHEDNPRYDPVDE